MQLFRIARLGLALVAKGMRRLVRHYLERMPSLLLGPETTVASFAVVRLPRQLRKLVVEEQFYGGARHAAEVIERNAAALEHLEVNASVDLSISQAVGKCK